MDTKKMLDGVRSFATRIHKLTVDIVRTVFKGISRKKAGLSFAAIVFAVSITAASVCYALEYNSAIAVLINDKKIGFVQNSDKAKETEQVIYSSVYGALDGIIEVEFEETLVFGQVSEPSEIAELAFNSVEGVKTVYGLFVDGEITAYADSESEMQSMLIRFTEEYLTDGAEFKGFANLVEIKQTFVTNKAQGDLVTTIDGFLEGKTGVKVITSRVENYDEEIPYETVIVYDEARVSSYNKVVKKGKNGLSNVTADVIYVNGKRVKVEVITSEVLVACVNEKVKKGLCQEAIDQIRLNYQLSDKNVELMKFPCEITERTYISSYWGDRRNHKGVDIASPKGSDIYAAADGTVSFVGTFGAYGKCIIIDHPDGKTQTLYSHNSKNLVKKGDKVTAGQVIAAVGATGNATGNHLHFSVLVNGKHVNPEKYLGIYDK